MQNEEIPPVLEIPEDELRRRLSDPSLRIVNVLSPEAFASGHISGSINLPLEDLERLAPHLLPDPEQDIAVYCGGPT